MGATGVLFGIGKGGDLLALQKVGRGTGTKEKEYRIFNMVILIMFIFVLRE